MKDAVFDLVRRNVAIATNAFSLVGATAVNSVLGFAFWWFAANRFTTEAVGLASALTAAMSLVGLFSMLGLGTLLVGLLPSTRGPRAPVIIEAASIVGLVGFVFGIVTYLVLPTLIPDLGPLGTDPAVLLLFAVGAGLTALVGVVDQSLIGMLRGGWQLWRNSIFAASKLAGLIVVSWWIADQNGVVILTTWVAGLAASLVSLWALVHRARVRLTWPRRTERSLLRSWRPALRHHYLNLALQAPGLVLPVIVVGVLSAEENAYFYVAWMVAGAVYIIPFALTMTLYAAASAAPEDLSARMRFTLLVSVALVIPLVLGLQFGSELLMSIFGSEYADGAGDILQILVIGAIPIIVKDHYVAIARVRNRIGRTGVIIAACSAVEVLAAAAGAVVGGLVGLAVGWLVASTVVAMGMFGSVRRTAMDHGSSAVHEDAGRATPLVSRH